MMANSSFSSDFLNVLTDDDHYNCLKIHPRVFIFIAFNVAHFIILLPPCISILYTGFQQLRQKSPSSTISHCDIITYHMVGIQLIGFLGCFVSICGNCIGSTIVLTTGVDMLSFTWYGQIYFHMLTCLERYLAVVHPITYLSLRSERGIRFRNVTIGGVWLLCFVAISIVTTGMYIYLDASLLILSTIVVSFCSLSVLWVLIHPGPGDRGERGQKVDQSKRRAFYTIVIILGLLLLKLLSGLIWAGFDLSGNSVQCMMIICSIWIDIPSSLVLPLLFLQRAGKCVCLKNKSRVWFCCRFHSK